MAAEQAALPPGWQKTCEQSQVAIAVQGVVIVEIDIGYDYFLGMFTGELFELIGDDAKAMEPAQVLRFDSIRERELFLQVQYGEALKRWRHVEGPTFCLPEPMVGWEYPIELGNGNSHVIQIQRNEFSLWVKVLVEFVAGCMPVPPEGNWNATEDQWQLPIAQTWLSREQWIERLLRAWPSEVAIESAAKRAPRFMWEPGDLVVLEDAQPENGSAPRKKQPKRKK